MYSNSKISNNINDLKVENTILFEVGNALDGFPMLLSLRETFSGINVLNAVDTLKKQLIGFSGNIQLKYDEMSKEIIHEFRYRSFVSLTRNNIEEEYFLETNFFDNCHYKTAAQKIFGSQSPINFDQKYVNNNNKAIANTIRCFGDNQEAITLRKKIYVKKALAVNTATQMLNVFTIPKDDVYLGNIPSRPFISERLDGLCPTYQIKSQNIDTFIEVLNQEQYWTFKQNYNIKNTKYLDSILLKRQHILHKLANSISEIHELHQIGKIHGDIKPSNMLFDGFLFRFIDSLDVLIGQVSFGFTKNYCAPEQVTASPVSPATDVYNIGLLILQLLGGVLVGPLSEVVIPTGASNTTIVKIITKPSVYLDRLSLIFSDKKDIQEWQAFLEKSLAYKPSDRYQDVTVFREHLVFLLDKHPLNSSVEINANFGRLRLPSYTNDKMYWVV